MDVLTVLSIVLAALAACFLVWFQYYHKNPRRGSTGTLLAALRFISVFCGLLLLLGPSIVDRETYVQKADLILLADRSTSMARATDQDRLQALLDRLRRDSRIQGRFNIHQYGFGEDLLPTDSIVFDQTNTDITQALTKANGLFMGGAKALVLFSDGNQTLGRDYGYLSLPGGPPLYPVVLGDTTQFEDLAIGLFNANPYAFLDNSFPVEASIRYHGDREVSQRVTMAMDGRRVHQEVVTLGPRGNSRTLQVILKAERVGPITLTVAVEPLAQERNRANNEKRTAVEVIDERSQVVIISEILHPDLGALKRSIEANRQRQVTLLEPREAPRALEDADLLILYQPTRAFAPVYEFIEKTGINYFTLIGSQTDWNFLNRAQTSFTRDHNDQMEEILPVLNRAFGKFGLGNFQVDGFPPLEGPLGEIQIKKQQDPLLFQQIRGVALDRPLLTILTEGEHREAVLFGENLWRWRAQAFRDTENFTDFDDLMGQLMRYLGANGQRNRLVVEHAPLFENAGFAKIRATYFDRNYQFDPRAELSIRLEGVDQGFSRQAPLLLKDNHYQVDLADLVAGTYRYIIKVEGEDLGHSGQFTIMDFDAERQFVSANYKKMEALALRNKGRLFFPGQLDRLIDSLATSKDFIPVQGSREKVVSLIDFRWLLALIAMALAAEWGIRKYNGLM